jgi:N6-L-threonylcarbamoyladenine synthase
LAEFATRHPDVSPVLVAAGGVASNQTLRSALTTVSEAQGASMVAPPPALCTDNAAMVAWAGIERLRTGAPDTLDFRPRPRWPLAELHAAQ